MKNKETARRLSYALEKKGMKAQELSEKSGVSKASISQYINGAHIPSNISAGKMSEVLGVNPLWLMGFDVQMYEDLNPQKEHYYDEETAFLAQQLFDDPDLHALLDAAKDSRPEYIKSAIQLLKTLKETNPDG